LKIYRMFLRSIHSLVAQFLYMMPQAKMQQRLKLPKRFLPYYPLSMKLNTLDFTPLFTNCQEQFQSNLILRVDFCSFFWYNYVAFNFNKGEQNVLFKSN